MSTAPANPTQQRSQSAQDAAPALLDQVIAQTLKQKVQVIDAALTTRADEIEKLLPTFMKGQAPRLIARAKQYFARGGTTLHLCSEASFIKCVLEAAEYGFAIDGKMVHAVPYNCKMRDANGKELRDQYSGKPVWGYEAQLIPDYKGLIAVAKRCKVIQDCWARIIYPTDIFSYEECDGVVHYTHAPDRTRERDSLEDAECVLAVATHHDGWFRTEIMPTADVFKIRARSKSYKDADSKTPWNTDPGEMAKKTTIKRLLKTFSDDPGLTRLMDLDDRDYVETDTAIAATAAPGPRPASKAEEMAARVRLQAASADVADPRDAATDPHVMTGPPPAMGEPAAPQPEAPSQANQVRDTVLADIAYALRIADPTQAQTVLSRVRAGLNASGLDESGRMAVDLALAQAEANLAAEVAAAMVPKTQTTPATDPAVNQTAPEPPPDAERKEETVRDAKLDWENRVAAIESLAACMDFRANVLPTVPAELRPAVLEFLLMQQLGMETSVVACQKIKHDCPSLAGMANARVADIRTRRLQGNGG